MYKILIFITLVIGLNSCGDTTTETTQKQANTAKTCTVDNAIGLYYKVEELEDKFRQLSKKWSQKYHDANQATLQDSKQIKILAQKKEKVQKIQEALFDTFKEEVKIHITDNHKYDLACANYKKLENTYKKKLDTLQKEFASFQKSKTKHSSNPKDTNTSSDYDALANQKYNDFVYLINYITPHIRKEFASYATECGTNKEKRVRARVEAALKISGGKNRKAYEETYGFHLGIAFDKDDILKLRKLCTEILSIDRFKHANKVIKQYQEDAITFMKLYSEDVEYFSMKDYTDDNFTKANKLHAPIITAFENVLKGDMALRVIVDEISDKQTRHRIQVLKENNEMLLYYVVNGQYLAKKLFEFSAHEENIKDLDAKEVRKKYDLLRTNYDAFKDYANTHENMFHDNPEFKDYLEQLHDYLSDSKAFYINVKNKKPHHSTEEAEFLKYIPAVARQSIESNTEGTISKLLKSYNALVNQYNRLKI